MEQRVNRLVSAYDGRGKVLTIGTALKEDMVTVWRDRGGRYEVSWWSGKSISSEEVREFADALKAADSFIHSVKTDKVFVLTWVDEEGERDRVGVLHKSEAEAAHLLVEIAGEMESHLGAPEGYEHPFRRGLEVGTWSK